MRRNNGCCGTVRRCRSRRVDCPAGPCVDGVHNVHTEAATEEAAPATGVEESVVVEADEEEVVAA